MVVLEANHIHKTIKGTVILQDISMQLESGVVYGVVGRNGSGKTMLFRALSGLMKLNSGEVLYKGKKLHKDFDILPSLGIILEHAGLYSEFTGLQNLEMLASIKKEIGKEEIRNVLQRVGLDPDDKRNVGKYSMGMKQRLAIAQAIMEHPEVIMLDEPTNGLDEEGVQQIRQIIIEEKERGALILLASHNKDDITLLADKVMYIATGQLAGGGK